MLQQLKFTDTLSLWKTRFNFRDINNVIELCEKHISNHPEVKNDGYDYYTDVIEVQGDFNRKIDNELDEIMNFSINCVIKLYDKPFNKISTQVWVNIMRAVDPKQRVFSSSGELIYHKHTELNEFLGYPKPNYTFVSYIQMPNNLTRNDGVLFLKDDNGTMFEYLPKEGECIIINGDVAHVPNVAKNSTKNRIVLAGNVRFDMDKNQKTLI